MFEDEIGSFLEENPQYSHRVSILRPDFQKHLLDWAGVMPGHNQNIEYAKQCPFYSLAAIDAYSNVLLCCNDAYFARTQLDRNFPGFGNLNNKSFTQFWKESEATREKLFDGTHIRDIDICKNFFSYSF